VQVEGSVRNQPGCYLRGVRLISTADVYHSQKRGIPCHFVLVIVSGSFVVLLVHCWKVGVICGLVLWHVGLFLIFRFVPCDS
jgi:hypothetical protein